MLGSGGVNGTIDGGGMDDVLQTSDQRDDVTADGDNSGTVLIDALSVAVAAQAVDYLSLEVVDTRDGNDVIQLVSGAQVDDLRGGTGNDTLTAPVGDTTFNVTADDAGDVMGDATVTAFSSIENLNGNNKKNQIRSMSQITAHQQQSKNPQRRNHR